MTDEVMSSDESPIYMINVRSPLLGGCAFFCLEKPTDEELAEIKQVYYDARFGDDEDDEDPQVSAKVKETILSQMTLSVESNQVANSVENLLSALRNHNKK